VRFFELLAEQGSAEYVVFHGDPPGGTGHVAASPPFAFANVPVRNRDLRIGGRRVVVQPIVRAIERGGFDAAVLGADLKLASNSAVAALSAARGRPWLLWGQGADKAEDVGTLTRRAQAAAGRAKAAIARAADGYLVYTEGGAQRLVDAGVPADRITVVRNTLDVESEIARREGLADAPRDELRRQLGLRATSAVLVYLGRLYREKRPRELLDLLWRLRELGRDVELVVLGDGPELPALGEAAAGIGDVHLLGDVREPDAVASHLSVATAVVIPGKVGLAINHAFAHGVPLITRSSDLHAPEVEYLEHERNGLMVEGDLGAYVRAVARVIDDAALRARLAAGARATAATLTAERMAEAFDGGVVRAMQRRRS
jgi:glycosyltransferase involved in cell wall biosynthesis